MARRNSTQTIRPFPQELDRHYFAAWLTGFTDGEGCFYIYRHKNTARLTRFKIALRDDDSDIVYTIQAFFGCGLVFPKPARGKTEPQMIFEVGKPNDLVKAIIPHFDTYPLQAKKKRDYAIWREATILAHTVSLRKRRMNGMPRGSKQMQKWTTADAAAFDTMNAAMRAQRRYKSAVIVIPKIIEPAGLF